MKAKVELSKLRAHRLTVYTPAPVGDLAARVSPHESIVYGYTVRFLSMQGLRPERTRHQHTSPVR